MEASTIEPLDWRLFLDTFFAVGLHILRARLAQHMRRAPESARASAPICDDVPHADREAIEAANLLGVNVYASADEVRAAFRATVKRDLDLHPDRGGDPENARRLIDAKNLLIERARVVTP